VKYLETDVLEDICHQVPTTSLQYTGIHVRAQIKNNSFFEKTVSNFLLVKRCWICIQHQPPMRRMHRLRRRLVPGPRPHRRRQLLRRRLRPAANRHRRRKPNRRRRKFRNNRRRLVPSCHRRLPEQLTQLQRQVGICLLHVSVQSCLGYRCISKYLRCFRIFRSIPDCYCENMCRNIRYLAHVLAFFY
jgi:hypothetical protein